MPHNFINYSCDILVAGAGFAGSLASLILHQLGFKVCLVEKAQHPRFAIGESSTPIADMILRDLAKEYDLPWLYEFSRYGNWQQSHPDIVCGLKRGFSYFKHFPGENFQTDSNHKNELLVAASINDVQSDTHWLRAEFDAFLVNKVKESGITYLDLTEINAVEKKILWQFYANRPHQSLTIQTSFFIDATGNPGLLENLWNIKSTAEGFLTNSYATFSHFHDVMPWAKYLEKSGISTQDYPFNPDHSALHHLLEEGWLWMLRFNDERLSMGLMLDGITLPYSQQQSAALWNNTMAKYPSINKLMDFASLATEPGKIIHTGRVQRILKQGVGPGWIALPHTIGFVDPLHSTGIAHTLCGLEKVIKIIHENRNHADLLYQQLQKYEQSVFEEIKFIDQLVAGCYKTLSHFDLFNAWSMLYFTVAIAYEQKRLQGKIPSHFLEAGNSDLRKMTQNSFDDLLQILENSSITQKNITLFAEQIRDRIKPYNIAGLLNPSAKNMYHHTTAQL